MNFLASTLMSKAGQLAKRFHQTFIRSTKPALTSPFVGAVIDLTKTKSQLVAENAFLRQQLIVLHRQVQHPQFKPTDRFVLVVLSALVRNWKQLLLIAQPETLLRWHRQGFKLLWNIKSKATTRKPKVPAETIALIQQMARDNPWWGAERIRGELLKLPIALAKRTIQKYMHGARPTPPASQNWRTFLNNHAHDIWACDFLPVTDVLFRPLSAFVIVQVSSRKIMHVGVTRHPTDAWTAQQLREATPFGAGPKYLLRDNDAKFGAQFERVAAGASITVLKTPIQAPNANAICERLMRSIRQECLDHFVGLSDRHLNKILKKYVAYYNRYRPHQGIGQATLVHGEETGNSGGKIVAFPILEVWCLLTPSACLVCCGLYTGLVYSWYFHILKEDQCRYTGIWEG
jgi:putative transposase